MTLTLNGWTDSKGNVATQLQATFSVTKAPTVFFIELQGGVTLNAAGLLSEPIFDIRGHVLFQADPAKNEIQLFGSRPPLQGARYSNRSTGCLLTGYFQRTMRVRRLCG